MKKRIQAFILSIVLIVCQMPANQIFATEANSVTDEFVFETNDNDKSATITGYSNKNVDELVIPKTVTKGGTEYKVTAISDNSFSFDKYPNLTSFAVLGDDVIIGEKVCGFNGDSRNDDMVVWGNAGSTINQYATQQCITFKTLAQTITDISTEQDVNGCFTKSEFYVYAYLTNSDSEDIIWSSENDEQITIIPGEKEVMQDGTVKCPAAVTVISKGDGDCNIYANTRSGLSKSLNIRILQSATGISIQAEAYTYDKDTKQYSPKANVPNTFFTKVTKGEGESTYDTYTVVSDVNTYILLKPTIEGSDDDELTIPTSTTSLKFVEEYNGGYMMQLLATTGQTTTSTAITTKSGAKRQNVNFSITQPATSLAIKLGTTAVSGIVMIKGNTLKLTAALAPTNTTDTVEWKSLNSNVAVVSEDGTVDAKGMGTTTITCTVKDTLGDKRTISESISVTVNPLVDYHDIIFTDQDDNQITELDIEAGTTANLHLGELNPTGEQPNENVMFTSSDKTIATVDDNGLVKAIANKSGKVTITVNTASGQSATLILNVYIKTTAIDLIANTIIPQGQSRTISYALTPSNSTEEIKWEAKDPSIVSVVDNGDKTITVSALAVGSTTIYGKTKSGSSTATMSVSVCEAIHMETLGVDVADTTAYTEKYVNDDGITVYRVAKGKTIVFSPSYTPLNANDQVSWSQSTNDVANVVKASVDNKNLSVVCNTAGQANFILKSSGGLISKFIVEVIVPSTAVQITTATNNTKISQYRVNLNGTGQVKAYLTPTNSTDKITWSADNTNIALSTYVTKNNEAITINALHTGTTTLTATTESGLSTYITVTVQIPATDIKYYDKDVAVTSTDLLLNDSKTISVVVLPENTTDTKLTWKASNSFISLTPSEDGKSAVITGLAVGNSTVTITTESGKTSALNVKVLQPADSIQFNCSSTSINIGKYIDTGVTVGPTNANDGITYTSSDKGVATVLCSNGGKSVRITGLSAGTATITATTGSGKTASIDITVTTIGIDDITVTGLKTSYVYNGGPIKPGTTITSDVPTIYVKYGTANLVNGTDYELSYENNDGITLDNKKAKVIIKGKGKYSGTKEFEFTITPRPLTSSYIKFVDPNDNTKLLNTISIAYTGYEIKPTVVVSYMLNNKTYTLVNGTDYDITYPEQCTNKQSSLKVSVTFKGNYSGSGTLLYNIIAKPLSSDSITASVYKATTAYTYTGSVITPLVTVMDGNKKLVKNTDFTVRSSSINAGVATVTITGIGNYSMTTTASFTIKPKSLTAAKISAVTDKVYTGSEIKPGISVKLGDITVSSSFYTITYLNNKEPGSATIKVTGKGNYTGTCKIYFKILPKQVTGVTQSTAKSTSVTITWKKSVESVSGYLIYRYYPNSKSYSFIGFATTNSYTIKNLSSGNSFQYAVKAYKQVGIVKYASALSPLVTVKTSAVAPGGLTLKTVNKTVTATWTKSNGANTYEVYYSTNGSTYKKLTTTAQLSSKISNLKAGSKCYVKVRAVTTIAGKTYYSSYTSAKTITVK